METLAALIAREGRLSNQEAAGWVIRLGQRIDEQHRQGLAVGSVSAHALVVDGRSPSMRGSLVDAPRPAEPAYLSPERASSGQASMADDVWALGVVLFYGLTGQFPFQVSSPIDVARAVALGAPRVMRFGHNDPALQSLIDRVFARDPARRLSNLAAFVQGINQWLQDPSVASLPPLDNEDEDDMPTMMMQSLSHGSLKPPQAPLPAPTPNAPRPAAGIPAAPGPAAGMPAAPVGMPGPMPGLDMNGNPRQAPTMMAMRPPEPTAPAIATGAPGPAPKSMVPMLAVVWAVVTFGGAAIEYMVLSR